MILTGYCLLAFLAAWIGGELPALVKLTHTRLQLAVSFVAGLMLGLSLLGLLPQDQKDVLASSVLFPKRLGTPDDFASLAVEIVQNGYLNGETIRLDGGIRMPPK